MEKDKKISSESLLVNRLFKPELGVDIELFSLFHAMHVSFFDPESPSMELGPEEFYHAFGQFVSDANKDNKFRWPHVWHNFILQMEDNKSAFYDLCSDIFLGLGNLENAKNYILSDDIADQVKSSRKNEELGSASSEGDFESQYLYITLPDFTFTTIFDFHSVVDIGEEDESVLFQIYYREKVEGLTDDKSYFKIINVEDRDEEIAITKVLDDSPDHLKEVEEEMIEFVRTFIYNVDSFCK